MVEPFCEGADLNCGCPQTWACKEGIGACLIEKPDFVADLVRQTRNQERI
jgi:tRNA-dihydrouridine synthase 4